MAGTKALLRDFRLNRFGERESRAFVVTPEDIEGATVRGWISATADFSCPLVILEVEDRHSRSRRALVPKLARGMVEILTSLSQLRVAGHRSIDGPGHPGWCAQQEWAGGPHRSGDLVADCSDSTVSARLVHGQHHTTDLPTTFITLTECYQVLEWPPISAAQHDALIGELAALLERHPWVVDWRRNPIG